MGLIKCAVPGCEDRCSPRHRFPVFDQELYEEWLKRIGRKELSESDPKFVGTNKRICSIHFSSHCRIPNSTKLKNRSLPTLHLPGFKEAPSEENSILKYPHREVTIARAELIQYIKDFKPEPDDLDVEEPEPVKPSADLTAAPEEVNLLAEPVSKEAEPDSKHHSNLPVAASSELCNNVSQIDVSPSPNKPVKNEAASLPPALDYVSSDSDNENSITEPMNIDFTYLMKITSLPDSPLIKDEPSLKSPSVISSRGKRCSARPEIAEIGVPHLDALANIEPMNIDFTYLMKITSLPDSPLVKDDSPPSRMLSSQYHTTINLPESVVDCLPQSLPGLPTVASEDPPNHSNLLPTSFDLEELIHERCKFLLAEIPSTTYI